MIEEEENPRNEVQIGHPFGELESIKLKLKDWVEFMTGLLLCYLILILADTRNTHFSYCLIPFLLVELKKLLLAILGYCKSQE